MQCATHPAIETELACSRCGKAICSRCLIHTPVGARCRECANVRRIPTYNISGLLFARAVSAGLGAGAAIGVAWWWFDAYRIIYVFFGVLLGIAIGYAVGEGVAIAANRRAGPPLQAIAVAGVVLAYVIRSGLLLSVDGYAARFVFDLGSAVAAGIACFIAAGRLR
jgi:hypothetical protein